MLLSDLLKNIDVIPTALDRQISSLTLDSRKIEKHGLFIAIKGTQADGRQYISNAIKNGAAAVLVESQQYKDAFSYHHDIPIIAIKNLRQHISRLAAKFYDNPAKKLRLIGVTGTNGKTSCTHFIAQCLQALHIPCGIVGTLGNGFYGSLSEAGLTTPDAITLQALLSSFVKGGAHAVALEVSSHSIDQGRINDIEFDLGVFTNLTQDHLDYHGTMETYASVKKRFLSEWPIKQTILNADDQYGNKWINELVKRQSVLAYSVQSPQFAFKTPSVLVQKAEFTLHGINAAISTPWGNGKLVLPLIGQFNLSNVLAVLAVLCSYGIPLESVLHVLSQLKPVQGRMQTLGGHGKPLIVVDYAHSPDALEKVLQALREHTKGKLICVFGCGGDRDHGKRPLMAKIAEKWADKIIVTNDNPRFEKPEMIAEEIMQGFVQPSRVCIILDRSKAIEKSIQWALADDCVLIAGKGAERYQQIEDQKIPFDDVEEVRRVLRLSRLVGEANVIVDE